MFALFLPLLRKRANKPQINIIVVLGFMSFTAYGFWLSLYMQNVLGFTPLKVAIHLLPQAIAGIIVNIIAGAVLHKIPNRILMGIGALAYTISPLLLALMKEDSSYWAFIFPSLILAVVGADLQFNVANMYVMSSLPPHQQSLAGGIFNTITKVCAAVGLGISTSIYNAESTGTAALQTGITPYRGVFWFCVASAGVGILFVPFLTLGTQGGKQAGGDGAREEDLKMGSVAEKGKAGDLGEEIRSVNVDVDRASVKGTKVAEGVNVN